MARIKWVQQRLENWGMWASRGGGGSGGYPTESVLAAWAEAEDRQWSRYRCGGTVIPINESEAWEIDRAVASFKDTRPNMYEAVVLVYAYDFGVLEAAYRARVAESTMHARLAQADSAVAMWLEDRAAELLRKRAAARGSFTP